MSKTLIDSPGIYLTRGGALVNIITVLNNTAYNVPCDTDFIFFWQKDSGKCARADNNFLYDIFEKTNLKTMPTLPKGYEWVNPKNNEDPNIIHLDEVKVGDSFLTYSGYTDFSHVDKKHEESYTINNAFNQRRALIKKIGSTVESPTTVFQKGTTNMSQSSETLTIAQVKSGGVAVAKFIGNITLKVINYWILQPAYAYASRIMRSVRYVTFAGGVIASVYGYYHPEEVKSFVKSCIPTVTIEAPPILKG